jgi:plasmid stabilization system protein ParE
VNVHWTETALAHVMAVRDYIARDSPGYAQAMADRIVRRTEILEDIPLLGAEVPEYGDESIRELFEHPYRIVYRLLPHQIDVIAVIHGARRMPRTLPG